MRLATNLFSTILLLFILSCAGGTASAQTQLDAAQAEKLIRDTPGLQLVDVRTPEEFRAGYIAGAANIDFYDPKFSEKIGQLDKSKPILVYCAAGGRSGSASEVLTKLGFKKIYDLSVGYRGWQAAGKPVKI